MPTIVTISGTSRPENYTAHALAVVNDELEARRIVRGDTAPWCATV